MAQNVSRNAVVSLAFVTRSINFEIFAFHLRVNMSFLADVNIRAINLAIL